MMPSRLISPRVGRRPTMPVAEAGERIDWPVSLPVPSTAKFAAMAAPVPPLDPPAVRVRSYGFLVCPPSELTVVPVSASSVRLAFATMIGARLPEPLHHERIVWRHGLGERDRAARRRHVGGIEVVLQDDRNAVERTCRAGLGRAIDRLGHLHRARVHADDGAERWALVVVGLDAIQILAHQLCAGDGARRQRGMDRADRRLFQYKEPRLRLGGVQTRGYRCMSGQYRVRRAMSGSARLSPPRAFATRRIIAGQVPVRRERLDHKCI